MSNYTTDPHCCRVDVWKESGKWYETISVRFRGKDYKGTEIHEAFVNALRDELTLHEGRHRLRLAGMRATCLEPYHEHSHPISVIIPEK